MHSSKPQRPEAPRHTDRTKQAERTLQERTHRKSAHGKSPAPASSPETLNLNRSTGVLRLKVLRTPASRVFGPLVMNRMPANQGLVLLHTAKIHSFGLRAAIDLVFLDREGHVIELITRHPPWKRAQGRGAHAVLALTAGVASYAGIREGERLRDIGRLLRPRRRSRPATLEQPSRI